MRQPVRQHVGKRVVSFAALGVLLAAASGCGGSAPSDATPAVVDSALCTGATLTATLNGSVVTLSGTACAGGELKYLVRPPGAASFTVVKDYGPATTATYDTAGKASGRWDFALWTRDVGSKATYEGTAGASLLVGDVCTAATLTVTPLGGGQFDLAATATCAGGAPAEFKFLVKPAGAAAYQELRPYAKEPTFRWTANVAPGRADVLVYARRAGNGSAYEAYITAPAMVGAVCTAAKLTATPLTSDTGLDLAASATCDGGAIPEFKFLARAPGATTYTELRGYDTTPNLAWGTANVQPSGQWDLLVYARAKGNLSVYEAAGSAVGAVGAVCTAATLTVTPLGGGKFDLAAIATCAGGAPAEFKFVVKPAGASAYQEIRPYAKEPTFPWTANVKPGRADVLVYARRAGNGSTYEAYAVASAMIGNVCTAATLTATPSTSGTGLDLAASATCDGGAVPEFKFLKRAPGATTYTELSAYGTDPKFPWSTANVQPSGRWDLLVYARAKGNLSTYEALATTAGNVGATCTAVTLTSIQLDPPGDLPTSFRFDAAATCPAGSTAEYRFLSRAPGATTYEEFRGWSTDPTAGRVWNAEGDGRRDILVYARRQGNQSLTEASASVGVNIGVTCSAVSLTVSRSTFDGLLALDATATCMYGEPALYRFLVKEPGAAAAREIRGWDMFPSAAFDDRVARDGRWEFTVQARRWPNQSAYEASATVARTYGAACGAATLAANPTATGFELVGGATCTPGSTAQYRFFVKRPDGVTEELRTYGVDPRLPWDASKAEAGRYEFSVHVRRYGNDSALEATATAVQNVGPTCRSATLSLMPLSETRLWAVGTASCDAGVTPQYRFVGRVPGAASTVELRGWGVDPTADWYLPSYPYAAGRYEVTVQVRAEGNRSAYEATATAASNLGTSCSGAAVTATPSFGSTLLEATATCGTTSWTAAPEFRFLGRAPGETAYKELRGYSWEPWFEWRADAGPGRYEVTVQARVQGNWSTYEATAYAAANVGPACTKANLALASASPPFLDADASATCDTGAVPEFQFLGRAPGASTFTELGPYDPSPHMQWNTYGLGKGRYEVRVQVRAQGNRSTSEASETKTLDLGATCASANLTATPNGAGLDLAATASCGGVPAEYRFQARPPGAVGFLELRGWAKEPTVAFDLGQNGPGRYELRVDVRAAGNTSTSEATASISQPVGPTCDTATLEVFDIDGYRVGLQGGGHCSDDSWPELRFLARAPGAAAAAEIEPYAWPVRPYIDFDPSRSPGRWEFIVQARHFNNASDWESTATVSRLVGATCTAATLTGTDDGTRVSLGASATCEYGEPEYRYLLRTPGAASAVEDRAWSTEPNHSIDLARYQTPGRYEITVYARQKGNASTYEAVATIGRLVGPTCSAATLTSTAAGGTFFDLGATATCSSGLVPEYRFLVRGPRDASYRELRNYTEGATFRWDTAELEAGRYDLLVYARAAGNSSSYEAYAVAGRNVGPTCSAASLRALWFEGGVTLSSTATCTDGAVPEYQFLVRPPGETAYTEVRQYDPAYEHWLYGALQPGAYTFLVNVRAQGNASRGEASASASWTEADCNAGPGAPAALKIVSYPIPWRTDYGQIHAGDWLPTHVHVVDAAGCRVDGYGPTVTLALKGNPAGAMLQGTTSAEAVLGDAAFREIFVTRAGTYSLVATSPGLASAVSPSFTVVAGFPTAETTEFSVAPTQIVAGEPAVASITMRDSFGNPLVGAPVQLTAVRQHILVSPPSPTTDAAGHVTVSFSSPYTGTTDISFTAPGLGDGALKQTVTFVAGPPSPTYSTLAAYSPAYADDKPVTLTIFVRDPLGNGVPHAAVTLGGTGAVTLTQPAPANPGGYTTATARSRTVGTSTITASVGGTVVATLDLAFAPPRPVVITTAALPDGYQAESYSATLAAADGLAPYAWSIASGSLPAGLSLSPSGVLSGTAPSGVSSAAFTVRVEDASGGSATHDLVLRVYAPPRPTQLAGTMAYPLVDFAIPAAIVEGGKPPFTFAVQGLPAGLSVSVSTGAVSGAVGPGAVGSHAYTLTATDANGRSGSWQGQLSVELAPALPGGGTSVARWGTVGDGLTVIALDEANRPAAGLGVRVRRNGVEYAPVKEALTDAAGRAYLTGLAGQASDLFDVTVSGPGHATTSILQFNAKVVTVPVVSRPALLPRAHHQAAWDAKTGKVLVFGGSIGHVPTRVHRFDSQYSSFAYASDLLSVDPATGAVTELQAPALWDPPPTADGAMVAIGDRVVMFGGWAAQHGSGARNFSGNTYEWVGTGWNMSSAGPGRRAGAGFASDGARAYLFGGQTGYPIAFSNEVWKYEGTTWTKLATAGTPPSPRADAAVGVDTVRKKLVVIGGHAGDRILAEAWELDLTTLTWTQKAGGALATRKASAIACAPTGGKCFLFGGFDNAMPLADTVSWDGTTLVSLSPPTAPSARGNATLVATGGSRYLLVGGAQEQWDNTPLVLGDVWSFDSAASAWTKLAEPPAPPASKTTSLTVGLTGATGKNVQIEVLSEDGFHQSSALYGYNYTGVTYQVPAGRAVRVVVTLLPPSPLVMTDAEVQVPDSGTARVDVAVPASGTTRTLGFSIQAPAAWGTNFDTISPQASSFVAQPGNEVWSRFPTATLDGGILQWPTGTADAYQATLPEDPALQRLSDVWMGASSYLPSTCERSYAALLSTTPAGTGIRVALPSGSAGMTGVPECQGAYPEAASALEFDIAPGMNLAVVRLAPESLPAERIVYLPVAGGTRARIDLPPASTLVQARIAPDYQVVEWSADTLRIPALPGANGISEAAFQRLRWDAKLESGARAFIRVP